MNEEGAGVEVRNEEGAGGEIRNEEGGGGYEGMLL